MQIIYCKIWQIGKYDLRIIHHLLLEKPIVNDIRATIWRAVKLCRAIILEHAHGSPNISSFGEQSLFLDIPLRMGGSNVVLSICMALKLQFGLY